jgi:hypothetical protein
MIRKSPVKTMAQHCFSARRLIEIAVLLCFASLLIAYMCRLPLLTSTIFVFFGALGYLSSAINLMLIGQRIEFFDVLIADDVIILYFPTKSIKYNPRHMTLSNTCLYLKFPYSLMRAYTSIPLAG